MNKEQGLRDIDWTNNIYRDAKKVKELLKVKYNTDFKNSARFEKDWRKLHMQGGGFTKSVRINENVIQNETNGLKFISKEIKEGNIDSNVYKAIKTHNDFKKFSISTGGISSKIEFGYGYYESTYKYAQAPGIDNAFWLTNVYWSNWEGWEIDINEGWTSGLTDYKSKILKWGNGYNDGVGASNKGAFGEKGSTQQQDRLRDFNTFGLLYTPNIIRWYVNDIEYYSVTPSSPFTNRKNNKGERIGFVAGNMQVKFTNGFTDSVVKTKDEDLWKSEMIVKNFTFYN